MKKSDIIKNRIIYYVDELKEKYKVIRKNYFFKIKDSLKYKKIKKEKINYTTLFKKYYKKIIRTYPDVNLYCLVNNVKSLSVEKIDDVNRNGRYDILNNIIGLGEKAKKRTLSHEFLHMASSYDFGEHKRSGFADYSYLDEDKYICHGVALNEGYTELLNERLFGVNELNYKEFKYVCDILEKIVGEKNMSKMYFEMNLYGLIKDLSKYNSEDNVKRFILNLDDLYHDVFNHYKIDDKRIDKILELSNKISFFLIITYYNFLCENMKKNNISEDNMILLLENISKPLFDPENGFLLPFMSNEVVAYCVELVIKHKRNNKYMPIEFDEKNFNININ